jgi:hypothetical protein
MDANKSIITKGSDFVSTYDKYIVLTISLIITAISINSGLENSNKGESVSSDVSTIILSLLIGIGYFMFARLKNGLSNNAFSISMSSGLFLLVAVIIYTFVKINTSTFSMFAYSIGLVVSLTIFTGLAIFFYIFSNYLKSFSGLTGFLVYFLFYIPCLLLSFVYYIINEFKLTTSPVLILFVIELLLLLLYVYMPQILNHLSNRDGIPILEGSVDLNVSQSFSMEKHTKMPDMDFQLAGNVKNTIFQNYAISMWTYVNAHGTNKSSYNAETVIFNYGDGKPKVTYIQPDADDNTSHRYRIYFTNHSGSGQTYYDLVLPMQRWNNLVLNYSSTHADLFVNGHLERTFSFTGGIMPTFAPGDMITVGSENGLHGAISNVRYYQKTLSKQRIANMYTLFMKKTPPTINL